MSGTDHFQSSPDWSTFARKNSISLPSDSPSVRLGEIERIPIDYKSSRARQLVEHAQWRACHPLASVGYHSQEVIVPARDGHSLKVKISHPDPERMAKARQSSLPVLFVTFGGGWIQGTHTTEECWLLWPLYPVFDLIIVSVDFRVGPEHDAPIWVEDSWDVLRKLLSGTENALQVQGLTMDRDRVILAGSSAGAGISAVLSQRCRDEKMSVYGVILNVPVLCDYRHFARVEGALDVRLESYERATEAILPSGAMMWIWDTLYPDPSKSSIPTASPLLGNCEGLPRHMIFVAGQDALHDEAMAYATVLRRAGVEVHLETYKGVPHIFGEFWELNATKQFSSDVRRYLGLWLGPEHR